MHLFTKHTSLATNKGMKIWDTIFNYHSYMVSTILQCVSSLYMSARFHSSDYSHCSYLGSDNISKIHAVTNCRVEEIGPKVK